MFMVLPLVIQSLKIYIKNQCNKPTQGYLCALAERVFGMEIEGGLRKQKTKSKKEKDRKNS